MRTPRARPWIIASSVLAGILCGACALSYYRSFTMTVDRVDGTRLEIKSNCGAVYIENHVAERGGPPYPSFTFQPGVSYASEQRAGLEVNRVRPLVSYDRAKSRVHIISYWVLIVPWLIAPIATIIVQLVRRAARPTD